METSTRSIAAPVASEHLDASADRGRSSELADRLRVIEDALHIQRRVGLDPQRLTSVAAICFSASSDLERYAGGSKALDRIEADLESAERTLIDIDSRVSMSVFRRALVTSPVDPTPISPEVYLHYARLLARHFRPSAQANQRLDFLVTRFLSRRDGDRLRMLPWHEVESSLWYVVHQSRADGGGRASAVAFFRNAIARMSDIALIDELFDSGFWLDVSGYKLALRESLLDPDILYSCAEVNVALSNRIAELKQLEGFDEAYLAKRIEEARSSVEQIFAGDEGERPAEIEARVEAKDQAKKSQAESYVTARRIGLGTRVLLSLIAALAVAMGIGLYRQPMRNMNELVAEKPEDVRRIHLILESGSISRGAAAPMFVGRVNPSEWAMLSASQRKKAGEEIASKLGAREVQTALIFYDQAVVVQIVRGRVLFVDGA